MTDLGLVGPRQIAERLGVRVNTVYQWRQRGLLPAPALEGRQPVWLWETIERWAADTGRLKDR